MEGKRHPIDWLIAERAARQYGVVARRQLVALGLGRGAIDGRISSGRLHRVHRGVYSVGHPRLMGRGAWMAAVLACGDGALLSHRSAAGLWGLAPATGSRSHVTSLTRGGARMKDIVRHGVRRLHPDDRAERVGIPVTSVARTLLDLASLVRREQLKRAFEEAERLGVLDVAAVQRICERSAGRSGLRWLRSLVVEARSPPETRSGLERRFLRLIEGAGLSPPLVNTLIAGHEVDMAWPAAGLVIELDGFAYHRTRGAFERDRARDADLQLAGLRVLRLTSRRLDQDADGVVAAIERLQAAAGQRR